MKKIALLLLVLGVSSISFSQEYNFRDDSGLRQGKWRKFHVNSDKLFYVGQFKNDKPVGEFTYYYTSGKTKGLMNYDDIGEHCKSKAYYENGRLMAKGNYFNQKKDSTWQYYTNEGLLKSEENWKNGVKHGEEIVYYVEDGSVLERLTWENGKKNGLWVQFFEKGVPKVKGIYLDDEFEGEMRYFFPDGKTEIKGKYINGLRDGTWYYYNKDGTIYLQILYAQGDVLKEKKETGEFNEYTADNILISTINYVNGKKEGPFVIYHQGAEWVIEPHYDEQMDETYDKRILKGHNVKMKGSYKKDKLHGMIRHYNKAGNLTHEEAYENGVQK